MAEKALARGSLAALRHQIARIEGRPAETFDDAADADAVVLRHAGRVAAGLTPTGVAALDRALGGGLPVAALTELHGAETRDAGAVAGFALALACRVLGARGDGRPLLWIGTGDVFREAGFPYAPGLARETGIDAARLLFARAERLADALWIAEEAARLPALAAVVLELRGLDGRLDLTATRRLHRRAIEAGRPVLLLRHAGEPEPTAAPVRLVVAAAAAAPRTLHGGVPAGAPGRPAFTVAVGKSPAARLACLTLEWNADERAFAQRGSEDPVAVVSLPAGRAHPAPAAGTVVAFRDRGRAAAGDQPPRRQRPAHRRRGRAG